MIEIVSPWLRERLRCRRRRAVLRADGVVGTWDRRPNVVLAATRSSCWSWWRLGLVARSSAPDSSTPRARAEVARAADRLRRLQTATAALAPGR